MERANSVLNATRQENVAEHTWHATLLVILFAGAAPAGTNHDRVRDLLVTHDLVEIHAGDTWLYDDIPDHEIDAREQAAAARLFDLLPAPQRHRLADLWLEFFAQQTVEARFARAIDALHPMLMSWGPYAAGQPVDTLTPSRVLARKRPLLEPFSALWNLALAIVQSALDRGLISPDPA